MTGLGQGVAVLVVFDAASNPVVQTRAGFWIEVSALDQGIGYQPHLADRPLRVFSPVAPDKSLPGTSS